MKNTTTERDWLLFPMGHGKRFCCISEPPKPISDPVEPRHDPDSLLAEYRDESRWSAEIAAWGRNHSLFLEADEE
jgi:hypothetical protein